MHSSRSGGTHVEVLVRHVGSPGPPGNEMDHDVGVDALRDHQVRLEAGHAKRSAQPTQVCAASHVSTADRDATASKLVEEASFVHERQHEYVESTAQLRNQERPLPFSASDGERRAGKENS